MPRANRFGLSLILCASFGFEIKPSSTRTAGIMVFLSTYSPGRDFTPREARPVISVTSLSMSSAKFAEIEG